MFKQKLYDLLENDELNSGKKFIFDIFLATIILISIAFIFLENRHGELPRYLQLIDLGFTIFFVIEFIARFYVASDFKNDVKERGYYFAIMQKVRWFFTFTTIIDFLAIIPSIKFFRVFRTLRFLRLFRIFKAYRSIKAFRELDKVFTILKGMRQESRVFYVFLGLTVLFVTLISFALYMAESEHLDSEFSHYADSVWYSVKVIGFGDDTPKTGIGRLFAALLLLLNMTVFGFFVSIILSKIQNVMDAIASGKVGKIKLENHIVICGYTNSAQNVIDNLLTDKSNINNIVLVTKKELEDNISGVIYVKGDFTELKTLANVNISKAKFAVVFAEAKEHDTNKDVDLRTVMTIFNIERENPQVHTIAEINNEENAAIIKDRINGDEILYKDKIDAQIISNCISHKHISNMFYDIIDSSSSDRLREMKLTEIQKNKATVKEMKLYFIEEDATFLGFIDKDDKSYLSPSNDTVLSNNDRLIYLKSE